jgi:hypothetical protein
VPVSGAVIDGFDVMAVVGGAAWLVAGGVQTGALVAARSVNLLGTGLTMVGNRAEQNRVEWEADHAALLEWEAAARRVIDVNARIEVLRQHLPAEQVARLPGPLTPDGQSSAELDSWCRSTDAELDRVETDLHERVAAAALSVVRHSVDVERPVTAQEAFDRYHQAMADEKARQRAVPPRALADVTRILGRLAPDATDADRADVLAAAAQVAVPRPDVDHDTLLDELRLRVQRATERARARRADAIAAATMLQAIPVGSTDPELVGLRADLASVVAARRALDAELRTRATHAAERVRAALERDYVRASVADTLAGLGYEVESGFATVTGNPDRMRVVRPEWKGHAVQVVVGGDEVRAAVIRLEDKVGADARHEDIERERQWCQDLERVRSTLDGLGLRIAERSLTPPGERILPVAKSSARPAARQNIERERNR